MVCCISLFINWDLVQPVKVAEWYRWDLHPQYLLWVRYVFKEQERDIPFMAAFESWRGRAGHTCEGLVWNLVRAWAWLALIIGGFRKSSDWSGQFHFCNFSIRASSWITSVMLTRWVFFHKSNFIRLESSTTLYERGAILANAITKELKAGPRLLPLWGVVKLQVWYGVTEVYNFLL